VACSRVRSDSRRQSSRRGTASRVRVVCPARRRRTSARLHDEDEDDDEDDDDHHEHARGRDAIVSIDDANATERGVRRLE